MPAKETTSSVGESVEVPAGIVVVRPDGTRREVVGGVYVLDVPGVHVIDGKPVQVA